MCVSVLGEMGTPNVMNIMDGRMEKEPSTPKVLRRTRRRKGGVGM